MIFSGLFNPLFSVLISLLLTPHLVIIAAARQIQHLAANFDGIPLLFQHLHRRSLRCRTELEFPKTFLAASSSIVSRPTICSNWAMRFLSLFSLLLGSDPNRLLARSRNSAFQRDRVVSFISDSRLACISPFCPLISSSTTFVLYSAVYVFRSVILDLISLVYSPSMGCVQFLGSITLRILASYK